MNFEQILIKLGVDASGVTAGLGRVGNTVKAWGTSIVSSFNSLIGRMFVGTAILMYLNSLKDKILEIKRVSGATGASTNFMQGLMIEAEKRGISFESMSASLSKFTKLIGAAKVGSMEQVIQLKDMGIITDHAALKTLNFSGAMHNLAVQFDKLNDKQKQAYLLSQAFGKNYAVMQPIFEQGAAAVDKMSQGNFFTKIKPENITTATELWKTLKVASVAAAATTVNAVGYVLNGYKQLATYLGGFSSRQHFFHFKISDVIGGFTEAGAAVRRMNDEQKKSEEEISIQNGLQAAADEDGITVAEEKEKILQQQNTLLERQAELTADIADRDKEGVKSLADEARRMLGIKSPLQMEHTVTPRMRTALGIETLEEKSTLAWRKGDDKLSAKLQAEADQIRAANPWLKYADKNPMLKTENELAKVNLQLEPITRAANLVHDAK